MIRGLRLVLILGLILYLATGLAIVQQDEVGVVRRFGAVQSETWGPGLHWGLPWGLGQVDGVKIGQTRTITVGAQALESAPLARQPDPAQDEFLTGDLNLVTVQAVLQYRVADPARYLFASTSVERSLLLATESALTRVAGRARNRRPAHGGQGRGRRAGRSLRSNHGRSPGAGCLDPRRAAGTACSPRSRGSGVRRRRPGQERQAAGDHAGGRVPRPRRPIREAESRKSPIGPARSTTLSRRRPEAKPTDSPRSWARRSSSPGRPGSDSTSRRWRRSCLASVARWWSPRARISISACSPTRMRQPAHRQPRPRRAPESSETIMKRLIAGVLTLLIAGVLLWTGRRREPPRLESTRAPFVSSPAQEEPALAAEEFLRGTLDAARKGDVAAYLSSFGGALRQRLEHDVEQRGNAAFAADLNGRPGPARAMRCTLPSPTDLEPT